MVINNRMAIQNKKIVKIDHRETEFFKKIFLKNTDGFEVKIVVLEVSDVVYIEMNNAGNIIKDILIERKTAYDLFKSIFDSRSSEQLEKMIDYLKDHENSRGFVVIIGNWRSAIKKFKNDANFSKEISMVEALKKKEISYYLKAVSFIIKYLKNGINVITLPDEYMYYRFCVKLFSDNVENVYKHVVTMDYSNKKSENFAKSIASLVKGLGLNSTKILAEHYISYEYLMKASSVEMSNVIRRKKGKKERKKPLEKIVLLYDELHKF